LKTSEDSLETRLAVQRADVDSKRAVASLRRRDIAALNVRAAMTGVVQQVAVDEGQRVTRGANLARVANPSRLKVELRIAETQTKELRVGLPASIDTHNGVVAGHVSRIDPAAQNGTVTVDIALDQPVPAGARPDMTVDGVIELERIDNAIFVGRPAIDQRQGSISVFKVQADSRALRTAVQIGRVSANTIEIRAGLRPGDGVILSDTSAWDGQDVLVLR
jgi:HlyD family secretion protein